MHSISIFVCEHIRIFVLEFRASHERYEWHEHIFVRNRTCHNFTGNATLDWDWATVSSEQVFHDYFHPGKEPYLVGTFTFDDLVIAVSTPFVLLGVTHAFCIHDVNA